MIYAAPNQFLKDLWLSHTYPSYLPQMVAEYGYDPQTSGLCFYLVNIFCVECGGRIFVVMEGMKLTVLLWLVVIVIWSG